MYPPWQQILRISEVRLRNGFKVLFKMTLNTRVTALPVFSKVLTKEKGYSIDAYISLWFESLRRAGMLLCLERAFDVRRSLWAQW